MILYLRYIFIVCLGFTTAAVGQNFGARALLGTNFSQVDGDQLGGYHKLGLNAGIQINREMNEEWKAAFEIRYTMKGSTKTIDPDEPATFTLDLKYHYIEVPLLFSYTSLTKLEPYGGISLGVNVLNERDENGIVTKEPELKKTETALHLGCTYPLSSKIRADLRHSYSLLSIRDYPVAANSPRLLSRTGWFNRLFTLSLSYTLN